jgi:hypothetical protein
MTPPFHYTDFTSVPVGTDETKGRYGEVTIDTCNRCQKKWLRYFVQYEGFSGSGRWYQGHVSDEVARTVTPEGAVGVLEQMDWYFLGGSYFDSQGRRGSGRLSVDM